MAVSETDVSKRKDASTIRQRRAKVTYSYEPQHEDELALKVGDELIISGEDEEGWYQATLNGKSGVCPSNFVDLVPDPAVVEDMSESKKSAVIPPVPVDALTKDLKDKLNSSLTRGKDLDVSKRLSVLDPPAAGSAAAAAAPAAADKKVPDSPDDSKGEIAAKKVRGVGLGNIFAGGMPSKASLRPTDTNADKPTGSAEKKVTNEATAKKDNATTPADSRLEYAKADYDYQALNPDELSFKVGDIIRIITKECEDEGWWRGELAGLSGVFPDNFCTVIPLSEVPIPKRPTRTPSNDKGASLKKDDRNEKENHDRFSKFVRDEPEKSDKAKSTESLDKDKIEKASAKKDDHPPAEKPELKPVKKEDHTDKDKVEKSTSSLKKDDVDPKVKPLSSVSKPTSAPEKKPDRPEKPVLKPVVGKKPVAGTSRENTPPDVKSELKSTAAHSEAKSKPELAAASENHKQTDESRPRGPSLANSSGVRMRNAVDATDSKTSTSASSVTENGGVGFDSVNSGEKLVHPTASRARGPTRRPPSQLFRPPSDEDGGTLFPINGSNGVDSPSGEDMTKDREPKVESRKSGTSVAKNDSFLKQLDSALSHPKSPTSFAPRYSTDLAPSSGSLEDEVKTLKEELKTLKEDFGVQVKELRETLKLQAEKISSLEKELEKARKGDK